MEYLHSFTVTVLAVVFLCFLCESLAPEGSFGRYTAFVTGLVISLAIVNAFLKIRTVEFDSIDIPTIAAEQTAAEENVVAAQFSKELAAQIERCVREKFDAEIEAQAVVSCKDTVLTVERVCIKNENIGEGALSAFVKETFGITPEYV